MSSRTRRWGHGNAALARRLYDSTEPALQADLAAQIGVTQPAVSKFLRHLESQELAHNIKPGWLPNRSAMIDAYSEAYASRLTADEAWWVRLDSPMEQVDSLTSLPQQIIFGGDAAADYLAPWQFPRHAIVYASVDPSQMAELGFVTADTRALSSVIVRPIPDYRFASDATMIEGRMIAHPLHVAAELRFLGDRDEQIEQMVDL